MAGRKNPVELRSTETAEGGCLHMYLLLGAGFDDFSQLRNRSFRPAGAGLPEKSLLEIGSIRTTLENRICRCTKSGHAPVNGLHSIENTRTYDVRFFVDEKI
jgi:hypothetical protein